MAPSRPFSLHGESSPGGTTAVRHRAQRPCSHLVPSWSGPSSFPVASVCAQLLPFGDAETRKPNFLSHASTLAVSCSVPGRELWCFVWFTFGLLLAKKGFQWGAVLGFVGSSTRCHPSLGSILFFCFCWYVITGFSPSSECSLRLSCAPSAAESCPDHQASPQCVLFLKGDSSCFLSSPSHLLPPKEGGKRQKEV